MKRYFFITKESNVYALEGQTLNGADIDTALKVASPKQIRANFPDGTIFYSKELYALGNHYRVSQSDFFRLTKDNVEEIALYESLTSLSWKDPYENPSILDEIIMDVNLKEPTSNEGFFVDPDDWKLLIRNIKRNQNTMIMGPTGSGKTTIVKEICDRMGLDLHIFDMGSIIDPISSLLGVHRLENGGSIFDPAKFTQVIQTPCVILLDELNRSSIASNNVLFPCLDDRRTLNIEIAGSADVRSIPVHPGVTFIATANIGSEYTGTMVIDRALINRFFPFEMDVIPSEEESTVLHNRIGIELDTAKLIVKVANTIRNMAGRNEVSTNISIRETLMIASLVYDGWNLKKAMEIVYMPLFEGSKTSGERKKVFDAITSY